MVKSGSYCCVYGGNLLSDPMTYVYSAGFTNKYECVWYRTIIIHLMVVMPILVAILYLIFIPSALRPRLYTSDRL